MRIDLGLGVLAAGLGAGVMFLLDPRGGRRRRALLRDKGYSLARQATSAIDKTSRDMKNRVHGTIVNIRAGHPLRGKPALLNSNWPPAIRLMAGTAGGLMTIAGAAKGGPVGKTLSGIGIGTLAFAATNFSIRDLFRRVSTAGETQMPEQPRGSIEGSSRVRTGTRNAV